MIIQLYAFLVFYINKIYSQSDSTSQLYDFTSTNFQYNTLNPNLKIYEKYARARPNQALEDANIPGIAGYPYIYYNKTPMFKWMNLTKCCNFSLNYLDSIQFEYSTLQGLENLSLIYDNYKMDPAYLEYLKFENQNLTFTEEQRTNPFKGCINETLVNSSFLCACYNVSSCYRRIIIRQIQFNCINTSLWGWGSSYVFPAQNLTNEIVIQSNLLNNDTLPIILDPQPQFMVDLNSFYRLDQMSTDNLISLCLNTKYIMANYSTCLDNGKVVMAQPFRQNVCQHNYTLFCINSTNVNNCTNSYNIINSINVTNSYNVNNVQTCENCINVTNSKFCINCTNVYNVSRCINCYNVSNCTNCERVTNVYNSYETYDSTNSSLINSTSFCTDCYNVTLSNNCKKCRKCIGCSDCILCTGYYCQNQENCRQSLYLYIDWNPLDSEVTAFNCGNPVIIPYFTEQQGYKMPIYMKSALNRTFEELEFCHDQQERQTCCNRQTTTTMLSIFKHYRQTIAMRATEKISKLVDVFDQYKRVNYTGVKKGDDIQRAIYMKMRDVKIFIYKMIQDMDACAKKQLQYSASMMCLGCLPDWRWHQWLTLKPNWTNDEEFFTWDPNVKPVSLQNLSKVQKFEQRLSKQICDEIYTMCKPVMQDYMNFPNNTAKSISQFSFAISQQQEIQQNSQLSNLDPLQQQITRLNEIDSVVDQIRKFTYMDVNYYYVQQQNSDDQTQPDCDINPPLTPLSPQFLNLMTFRSQMQYFGPEYTFDPVVYYSFEPSISFKEPLKMENVMYMIIMNATTATKCPNYVNDKKTIEDPVCQMHYPNQWIFADMDTQTDRQYREFNPFFFQVRSVVAEYNYTNSSLDWIRRVCLPPFREGELLIDLSHKTIAERKAYYQGLEKQLVFNYIKFNESRHLKDEFTIWNDEYWMLFMYGQAFNRANQVYRQLISKNKAAADNIKKAKQFRFNCTYDGDCFLSNQNDSKVRCQTNKSQPLQSVSCLPVFGQFDSYCTDCHYTNVSIDANCTNDSCVTCLYIGGFIGDIDEDTGEQEEPMEKCMIRAIEPFFYVEDNPDMPYMPPALHRESDTFYYKIIEKMFDLSNSKMYTWNVCKIGEWFYKLKNAGIFSVLNIKKIDQTPSTFQMPDMSKATQLQYQLNCIIDHPVNKCQDWICNDVIRSWFPAPRIVYSQADIIQPEELYIENIWPDTQGKDFWSKDLIQKWLNMLSNSTLESEFIVVNLTKGWNYTFGTNNPLDNLTQWDVSIKWINTTSDAEYDISIFGITENMDLYQKVEAEEVFNYQTKLSFGIIIFILALFLIFDY